MTIITAAQHVKDVARKFPSLKLVHNFGWLIIWEGVLRSFSAEYRVRIFWHRYWKEDWALGTRQPRIYMLDPPMQDRADKVVPHAYPGHPRRHMCVYDPDSEADWNWSQSIADTIIPYAIQWLGTYELWHVTGEWNAPGRHPTGRTPCSKKPRSLRDSHGRQGRSMAAVNVKIGLLIGTFASSPLMGAASGESYRWLSWQNWRKHTFQADPLQRSSICYAAPRREASLHLVSAKA